MLASRILSELSGLMTLRSKAAGRDKDAINMRYLNFSTFRQTYQLAVGIDTFCQYLTLDSFLLYNIDQNESKNNAEETKSNL